MTEAEQLPSTLTVRYVLDNASKRDEESTVEDPKTFLQANGVTVSVDDSEEDVKAAARALTHDTAFWQKHFPLHPQKSRVKT